MSKRKRVKQIYVSKRLLNSLPYADRLEFEANLIRYASNLPEETRENIYEEIISSVKHCAGTANSHLVTVIGHLLKWAFQPEKQQTLRSWDLSIRNGQRQLTCELKEGKNVQKRVADDLRYTYFSGVELAVKETGLSEETFPEECPWSLKELETLTREELVNLLKERTQK